MNRGRALATLLLCACGGNAPGGCPALRFVADTAAGTESYVCFGFDGQALAGQALRRLALAPNPASAAVLHHVALFAVPADFRDGPVECLTMPPDAVELAVWTPQGAPVELPDGVGLALPDGTRRLVVQAHVLRTHEGPAEPAAVELCPTSQAPAQLAAWLPLRAPVPAIRPHTTETSTADCAIAAPLHVFSTWPHMHRIGTEFHGAVVRSGGTRAPLVDVVPWVFEPQHVYPVAVDLAAGDAIETTCVWRNDSDQYVLPGLSISDEMCNQSLIVWPAQAARCATGP